MLHPVQLQRPASALPAKHCGSFRHGGGLFLFHDPFIIPQAIVVCQVTAAKKCLGFIFGNRSSLVQPLADARFKRGYTGRALLLLENASWMSSGIAPGGGAAIIPGTNPTRR